MKDPQKQRNKKISQEDLPGKCETARCGCSLNYIYLGVVVILLVLFAASTIR